MRQKRIVLIIVASVIILGIAAGVYFALNPEAWSQVLVALELVEPETDNITASGFIEAEEVSVAPETGGRIAELLISEGEEVEEGQVLVRLDDTLGQAQLEVVLTGLEVAQATLDQILAGARTEEIQEAAAMLAQAEAGRDGAYQAWQDLLALIENPQELDAQIALAEIQLTDAEAGLQQANTLRDIAQIANEAFSDAVDDYPPGDAERFLAQSGSIEEILPFLPPEVVDAVSEVTDGTYTYEDWEVVLSGGNMSVFRWVTFGYPLGAHLIPSDYWRSWVGVNTAQAAQDGAQQALYLLYAMRNNPQELEAQADAAEAQYRATEALVSMAQAQLDGLRAGATDEEIAVVEAQVQQAQAQVESALVFLEKLALTAPAAGQVLEIIGHEGELTLPGATLVTVADLDEVNLTIYVPENRLGQVQVGQQVEVRVDSFPDRVFAGQVATIASEAEFTPRNVQTQEERVNMVFAVKVSIPNPDHALKPGMPADAVILIQEQ
jgi:multidrug efflux pump subunit AcrA (membrane-fusion protein)